MFGTAGDAVSLFSLSGCVRCGICDKVCPSGRSGGIHPDDVIIALIDSDPLSDVSVFPDVWKCLMCHRCSSACPKKIDVTGAIRYLRYVSASSGSAPRRFVKAGGTLASGGRAFPVNDIVNQRRKELGLDEIKESEASDEMRTIIKRTGFRNE